MILAAAVSSFCDLLHTTTGIEARLDQPGSERPGIVVWPYRLQEDAVARNQALGGSRGYLLQLHALVLVRPALDGLATLERVHQALRDTPVLLHAGSEIQLVTTTLDTAELSGLFLAAGAPLSLSLGVLLRYTVQPAVSQEDSKVVELKTSQRQLGKRVVKRKLVGV